MGQGQQLVPDGESGIVGEAEVVFPLQRPQDAAGQLHAAPAALLPHLRQGHLRPVGGAGLLHQCQLRRRVAGEAGQGHHCRQTVDLRDVLDVPQQIGETPAQGCRVLRGQLGLIGAAVELQSPDRGHDHHCIRPQSRSAALDIQKFLGTQIGAEARLRYHIVPQPQGGLGGGHTVAAVGDVGEGATVDDGGSPLQRLGQIGADGVLQ